MKMMKTAPDPIDVQDLQFKLRCRLKVFDNTENVAFSQHCSLVTCASRFGLVFVGTKASYIQAIQLQHIERLTKNDGCKADYPRRNLLLPALPLHLSVNCEHTVLAAVTEKNGCPYALFYDVKSFWQQDIVQVGEVCLSATPGVFVTETNWNPSLSSIFTACKSDGSLGIYEVKSSGVDINELPAAAGATCFCWSPKGKQIAVGSREGRITQLKPDLKAVKIITAPPLKEPHSLLSLQWVSNYQFIGVFQPVAPNNQALFIVIDAPKSGDPIYINYDDICYSSGNKRPVQFYLISLQSWNIVMAASSNSMEVGILGNAGECWSQWIMGDAARAELPLSANHEETLPVGCALDIGSIQPIPWGESTLPPAPLFLLLSHHGILCCFNIINLKEGIPSLCTPPDSIYDVSGLQHFLTSGIQQNSKNAVKELNKVGQQSPTQLSNIESLKKPSTLINITALKGQPQEFNSSHHQMQPVNLFGGQATLTPITQGDKSSQSFVSQHQSLSSLNNVFKNMTAASAQILSSTAASSHIISKPVISVVSNLPFSSALKLSQPEVTEDFNRTEVINVDIKAEEEAENVFGQMVREECIFLESEVKAVLHQGKNLKCNLGSDADKMKILENTKSLETFFHEVIEICATQNAEVQLLKQNLLQSWAWYEETKSQQLSSENEFIMMLIRAQPLDSASEKQLADIQHTNYYLESQISQANIALDEQWENFQDYCKKTHKLQIPTMEMIFQTMVKQNAILRKQSYIMKDIASRIRSKSRSSLGPSLLVTINNMKHLPDLKQLRMNPEDIYQMQYEHVVKRMKNFSKKKADALRSFLKKREYPHVSAVKPNLSTSVIQTSPSFKLKQHILLTPKTPQVGLDQENSSKNLNFTQSSPTPTISKGDSITSGIQSRTPIEGLQNFALKFDAKNFSKFSEKTFTPLTKNVIPSSPHSAFVSTSLGSSTSNVTSLSSKPIFLGLSPVPTTIPHVAKTIPSLVVVTTELQTGQPVVPLSTNLSKSFSFLNSSASSIPLEEDITNGSKSGVNLFSNSGSQSITSFDIDADIKNTSNKPTTSKFSTANKPNTSTMSVFNATQSTKSATSTTKTYNSVASSTTPISSSLPLSSMATSIGSPVPSFSFDSNTASNIFATGNQKSSELAVFGTANKPFIFSSKAVAPASQTIPNLPMTQQSTPVLNSQPPHFGTTTTSSVKIRNILQTSVSSAALVNTQNTTVSLGVPTSPNAVTKIDTTPGAASSVQPIVFSNTVTTTTAQSTIFSLSGTKPPLLTSTLNIAASPSITVSVVTCDAINTTPVAAVNPVTVTDENIRSSFVTASRSDQSPTGKQNIFNSTVNSAGNNSSTFSSGTSTTGFTFGKTPSSEAPVFGRTDTTNSKPPLFENSSIAPATNFGNVTTASTTNSSIFDVASSTTTTGLGTGVSTTQSSIFGAVSSTSTNGFGISNKTNTQSSIFGAAPAISTFTTKSSIFGSGSSDSTTAFGILTSTAQSSVIDTASSTTPGLGITTTSSNQSSIFVAAPSTSAATLGTSTTSTTHSSVFSAVSSTSTRFGTSPSTTQSSIFSTPPSTSTTSVFGTPTSTTTQSIFGSGTTNRTSVFGGAVGSAIFGNPSASSQSSQGFGILGNAAQKNLVFGNPSSTQSSIFSSSNQSTAFTSTPSSAFGQNQSSNTFGQPSIFGSSGTSFSTSNAFGTSASFAQSAGSIFGNAPPITAGSVFSGTATTENTFASSGTVYGAPVSSAPAPFGSGSVFSSNTTQPSSFSANTNPGSFGFGSLSVGSAATTSSSGFGSGLTSNAFGSENKNVFGGSPTPSGNSIFDSNSGPAFGSSSQGYGSQSPFGQQSAFGQTSFGSNTFGQTSGGPFSGGSSGGVGQSGFGTGASFQKAGGFGSSPVFGGSPSFGNAAAFGGQSAFGSGPKIFGSASPGFGTSSGGSQNTGFGNLANQPTVGFGNLAQQAASLEAPGTPFSGNSSFSNWR